MDRWRLRPRLVARRLARCCSICSLASTVFFFARVLVVFLQAVASIRAERQEDDELYGMCMSGAGRSSTKMRHACLSLAAERSSPVFVLALARTPGLVLAEVSGALDISTRAMSLLAVVLLLVFAPYAMAVRNWVLGRAGGAAEDDDVMACSSRSARHVVFVGNAGDAGDGQSWRTVSMAPALTFGRSRSSSSVVLEDGELSDDDGEVAEGSGRVFGDPGGAGGAEWPSRMANWSSAGKWRVAAAFARNGFRAAALGSHRKTD